MEALSNIVMKGQKDLREKEEKLITDMLIEQGRQDILDNIKKEARFPGIIGIRKEDWEYFFINDGTTKGRFLVAIQDSGVNAKNEKKGCYECVDGFQQRLRYEIIKKKHVESKEPCKKCAGFVSVKIEFKYSTEYNGEVG